MSETAIRCKICGGATELQGCVDAGRTCETGRDRFLPLTGQPIYYHRCQDCGFLFTTAFDDWSPADFRREIYNEGYAAADPDYADGSRSSLNIGVVATLMQRLEMRSLLDFGGGDGTLAAGLRALGFDARSWDPVADMDAAAPQPGAFELVTAFEVFEHTPQPLATTEQALGLLDAGGRLFFSTLLMDGLRRQATDHWYIAPRNGHISLHTSASLSRMFARFGWSVLSFDTVFHIATRLPDGPALV